MNIGVGVKMERLTDFVDGYQLYALKFLGFLGNPNHRLFAVYLLTSALVAYVIYRQGRKNGLADKNFLSFIFPKSVWSHSSAWLDVRYFFFHGLIGHCLLAGVAASAFMIGLQSSLGHTDIESVSNTASSFGPNTTLFLGVVGFLIVALVADFMGYFLHYLQHKSPILWQFHKVHHAGEVMHPLSNFREHPVDNLVYKFFISFTMAYAYGLVLRFLGVVPEDPSIFGIAVLGLFFNLGAYHLRHSHIWLKWPGRWSKIFASPAHHHVHHSRHPDHLDKNFAFMFPFWDVLFGTYCMPEDNRDVEFGIVEDSSELNSCINLYAIPFRDVYRLMKKTGASVDVKPKMDVAPKTVKNG